MYNCAWCGNETNRHGGNGHYYCNPECAHQARLYKQKLKNRKYLYLLGDDGKRHPVRVNKRSRSASCEICNKTDCRLDYHHWNDDNPAIGLWLCRSCHWHAEAYERGLINKYLELKGQLNLTHFNSRYSLACFLLYHSALPFLHASS